MATVDQLMKVTSQMEAMGREADFMPVTMEDAMQRMNNKLTAFFGKVNQSTGAVNIMTDAVDGLGDALDKVDISAIARDFAAIATTWDLISTKAVEAWDAVDEFGKQFQSFLGVSDDGVRSLGDSIVTSFEQSFLDTAREIDMLHDAIFGTLAALGSGFTTLGENIVSALKWAFDWAKYYLQSILFDFQQTMVAITGQSYSMALPSMPEAAPYFEDVRENADKARLAIEGTLGAHSALVNALGNDAMWRAQAEWMGEYAEGAGKAATATSKVIESAKKGATAYASLISSIRAKIEENQLEIAIGEKATEADKLRIKVEQELAAGKLKLTAAQKSMVEQAIKALAISEKELGISKLLAAADKQRLDLSAQAVKSVYDEARKNQDLVATFGMSKDALELLTISRLEAQLAQKESLKLNDEEVLALELLIAAHKENAGALATLGDFERQKKEWDDWASSMDQVFKQVGQSLTDRIFQGGKSGREMVKDLFKSLTLRILVEPVMKSLQGAVTNSLGGMLGHQNPAQGNTGGLSMDMFGGGGSNYLAQGMGWLGETFGSSAISSFTAGMTSGSALSGMGIMGAEAMAGASSAAGSVASGASSSGALAAGAGAASYLPYVGALFAASQGQYATAAGTAIGTAVLPGIGTAIGAVAGALIDTFATSKKDVRFGGTYVYDSSAGISAHDGGWMSGNPGEATDGAVNALVESAAAAINSILQSVDPNVYLAMLHGEIESSEKGRGGISSGGVIIGAGGLTAADVAAQAYRAGQPLSHQYPEEGGLQFGTFQRGQGYGDRSGSVEEMFANLQVDMAQTAIQSLQSVLHIFPDAIQGLLRGIDADSLSGDQAQGVLTAIQAIIGQVNGFREAVETLPFANLRDLSFDAAAGLIAAAGGLENLSAGMTGYFQNFYSQQEQVDHATQQMASSLGALSLEMPDLTLGADAAKFAYRGIVESLDMTTESGLQAFAALMALADPFAQLVTGIDELQQSSQGAAVAVQDVASLFGTLMGVVNSSLATVMRLGQERIAELEQSFSGTDSAMSAFRSVSQSLQNELTSIVATLGRGVKDERQPYAVSGVFYVERISCS